MSILKRIFNRIKYYYFDILWTLNKPNIYREFDHNWFKNKRVAIIGGADSAYQDRLGEFIDSFDVVVRINKGVEVVDANSKFIGSKTDVLFHCFFEDIKLSGSPITPELWIKKGVSKIVKASYYKPNVKSMNLLYQYFKNKAIYTELDKKNLDGAKEAINGYLPTTGFLALFGILNASPKELYITGITFLKTPHSKVYRDISLESAKKMITDHNTHNTDLEFEWFKNNFNDFECKVILDKTLKELINE